MRFWLQKPSSKLTRFRTVPRGSMRIFPPHGFWIRPFRFSTAVPASRPLFRMGLHNAGCAHPLLRRTLALHPVPRQPDRRPLARARSVAVGRSELRRRAVSCSRRRLLGHRQPSRRARAARRRPRASRQRLSPDRAGTLSIASALRSWRKRRSYPSAWQPLTPKL